MGERSGDCAGQENCETSCRHVKYDGHHMGGHYLVGIANHLPVAGMLKNELNNILDIHGTVQRFFVYVCVLYTDEKNHH